MSTKARGLANKINNIVGVFEIRSSVELPYILLTQKRLRLETRQNIPEWNANS